MGTDNIKGQVEELLIQYGTNNRADEKAAGKLLGLVSTGKIKDVDLQKAVRLGATGMLFSFVDEVAQQAAPSTVQAVVSQTLQSGVLIDGPGQYQLPAALLFDTGCSLDLIISHHKAQQLGIQPDDPPVSRVINLAGGINTTATRYKPVKISVVMNDHDTLVPDRSAWLEVYGMAGTQAAPLAGAPTPLPPGMVRTLQSAEETQATGGTGTPAATQPTSNPVYTLRLSPVKRGRDSQGHDAILGKLGMHKLGIGMDKDGRLFALAPDDQIISTT